MIVSLFSSWVPFVNFGSFFIAVFTLALGLISLKINKSCQKQITWIGIRIALATMAIAVFSQANFGSIFGLTSKVVDTTTSVARKNMDSHFKWTWEDYDALKEGYQLTGVGGESLDTIIKKFGEPTERKTSKLGDGENLQATYKNPDQITTVSLSFKKQNDGQYLLTYKIEVDL